MNLLKIINKIIAKFKLLLRSKKVKNLDIMKGCNLTIKKHHVDQIKKYTVSTDNIPIKINMIKKIILPMKSETKPPWNSTIFKVLKNKLKMSYKILHK